MIKKSIISILFLVQLCVLYSQDNLTTGFGDNSDTIRRVLFDELHFYQFADSILKNKQNQLVFALRSPFGEFIDTKEIKVEVNGKENNIKSHGENYFTVPINPGTNNSVKIEVNNVDYHLFKTQIEVSGKNDLVHHFVLKPKFKITLRGRVYAGNMPLEDVDVKVVHNNDTIFLKTRNCYYDTEDYWNCLYHGMYKCSITTEEVSDSIYVHLSKIGYQDATFAIKFDEYDGDILNMKIAYSKLLPSIYRNNVALKFTFPLISNDNWYAGFNYLYSLKLNTFERLALGLEGAILIKNHTEEYATFNGSDNARADTSYLLAFAGPSAVLWLTNPLIRNYSVYLGSSYVYLFNSGNMSFQPFLGGRFFVDLNKAISFDIRYLNYELDVVKYSFNPYGDALRTTETIKLQNQVLISLGLHIGF
ncbi:MAG: hypothetical protein MI922_11700 [Bacteroidales bacterium]|nr:hypothetical protein [Bacteroidales bacterium]